MAERRRFGRTPDWGVDHLSQDAVVAFVDDELSAAAHDRAERHVAACRECAAEVVAQRQVRSALRAADEPHVPASLLSLLKAIPQEAELPPPPSGLAVTAEGQFVSVLRPAEFSAPAGLEGEPSFPGQSRGRLLRVGATAVSGLALGAIAFVSLPGAVSPVNVPAQADRGALGGSVLGGSDSAARLAPAVQPAAVRSTPTPSPTTTPRPEER